MNKVLFKDQYTSGYAKKIAGSYTLVAGFLIRQYSFQYTCCILKELWGILILCGRHVYSRCRISYSLLHKSVYMIYTAWSRKGTDMFRRRYVYRFLHSLEDYPYMTLQRSVYFTYTVGSIRYRYYCCFKVGIRILIRFMTIFQAKYQCTH